MEGATSSSMLLSGGGNWPFRRSPGDMGGEVLTATGRTAKQQAEVDLRDNKLGGDEFNNFQWNDLREQVNNVSREVADMRKGYESLRLAETRHEVRDADFERMANDLQLRLEKVSLGHRQDGQEVVSTMTQLRQAFEIERSDRTASLQALQRDVAQQFKHLSAEHQQLEVDRERRGRRIEELQGSLEKESNIRQAEMEGKFSELTALKQNFLDQTRSYAHHTNRVDELEARFGKDHAQLQAAVSELHGLQKQFKDELGEVVGEVAKKTDIERVRRNSLEEDTAKQAACLAVQQDHHKNVLERLSDLEAQFLKDHTELSSTVDEMHLMQKQLQQEIGHVLGETQANNADFQRQVGEAAKTSDLHEHHQTLNDRVQGLHDRVERVNDLEDVLKELSKSVKEDLELHKREHDGKHKAHIDRHSELADRLAKFCASGDTTELIDRSIVSLPFTDVTNEGPCTIISKVEFDVALKQLWDAIDSHTHEVDVGALQRANALPVQTYQVGPATLPTSGRATLPTSGRTTLPTSGRPVMVPQQQQQPTLKITPPTTPQSPQFRAMAGLSGSLGMRTAMQQPPTVFQSAIRGRSVSPAPTGSVQTVRTISPAPPTQTVTRTISPAPPTQTVTSPLGSSLLTPAVLTMGVPAVPMNVAMQGGIRTMITQQSGPVPNVTAGATWPDIYSVLAAPGAPMGITTGPPAGSSPTTPYSPPSHPGAFQASLQFALPTSGSSTPPSGVRQLPIAVRQLQ